METEENEMTTKEKVSAVSLIIAVILMVIGFVAGIVALINQAISNEIVVLSPRENALWALWFIALMISFFTFFIIEQTS